MLSCQNKKDLAEARTRNENCDKVYLYLVTINSHEHKYKITPYNYITKIEFCQVKIEVVEWKRK